VRVAPIGRPKEGRMTRRVCPGSGGYAAEDVILDTVPGVSPKGTCSACGRWLTLDFYRVPRHTTPEVAP